jgi:hypothetical protein
MWHTVCLVIVMVILTQFPKKVYSNGLQMTD